MMGLGSIFRGLLFGKPTDPNFAFVPSSNQEMEDAMAQARESLPLFWKRFFDDPNSPAGYGLKVVFPTSKAPEAIWVEQVWHDGKHYTGRLVNEPQWMFGKSQGDKVRFELDQVVDWYFIDGEKQFGHFTTRVLPPRGPEGAEFMKCLSETPLPSDQLSTN